MAPNRQNDCRPFPIRKTFLPLPAVLIESVPRAISGANEDKWDEPGRRCCNRTLINGLVASLVQETASTEKNCDKPSKPSRRMQRRLHFLSLTSSYAWMDCMETQPL